MVHRFGPIYISTFAAHIALRLNRLKTLNPVSSTSSDNETKPFHGKAEIGKARAARDLFAMRSEIRYLVVAGVVR